MSVPTVNSERLRATLETLGRIGETPEGMQRVAYSPADIEGRCYITEMMRGAGLSVRVDPGGNIIGRREGKEDGAPAIAVGSHVDTVPKGGKYDGALGVLAALEAVLIMSDQGITTRHPLEVLVFTNEEGTRFNRWLLGSRAVAGLWEAADYEAVDAEGVGMAQHLKAIGGDLDIIGEAKRRPQEFRGYLELHIEQGPLLEQSGTPIGVVSGITGRAVFDVRVKGAANHAGTTPMEARQDALLAASRLTLATNAMVTQEEMCRVGTVGIMRVSPNAGNVIPGEVEMGVEFRDMDMGRLMEVERRLSQVARELAATTDTEIEISLVEMGQSCPISTEAQEIVAEAARRLDLRSRSITSGAGHDAQAMSAITESGMLFVPSVGGISHSPLEYTTPEDCANGANALLNALLVMDES